MPEKIAPFTILLLARVANTTSRALVMPLAEGKSYRESFTRLDTAPSVVPAWWCAPGLSDEFDIPAGSIAYHPVFGEIRFHYSWYYASTRALMEDLKAAEDNPNISAHLIHIDSVGGEAYGCHEVFNVIKDLTKPCFAVVESMAGSAGYYIAAACDKIYAASPLSFVGCIGSMSILFNDEEWLKKMGYEKIELYSNYSPLKNKVVNDALDGKTEEFVTKVIDPLALQFLADVTSVRPIPEDDDARKGEIYYAQDAMPHGLIDGIKGLDDALEELATAATPRQDLGLNNIPNL